MWACALAILSGGAGQAAADTFRILCDCGEAMQIKVDLIEQARCQIDLALYEIDCGQAPLGTLALLRDAARRGIRVRLLVDGLMNRLPAALKSHLLAEGIEIREYHPVQWYRPCRINNRMHDKLFIVDCEHLIVGSRNLEDEHFDLDPCRNYVDRDVYVRGCAAKVAASYFQAKWNSNDVGSAQLVDRIWERRYHEKRCDACRSLVETGSARQAGALLDAWYEVLESGEWLKLHTGRDWSEGLRQVPVQFMYDQPGVKALRRTGIERDIEEHLSSARFSIVLETPYLVLTERMKHLLMAARDRGVHIRILTNSLASTDQVLAQAEFENEKRRLLRAGVELWEYVGPNHLHAKSAVVDGRVAIIGSYNFDARSERENTEVAVAAMDEEAAAQLELSIEEQMANSYRIGPDGKPVGSSVRYPGAESERLKKIPSRRLIAPFVKWLL